MNFNQSISQFFRKLSLLKAAAFLAMILLTTSAATFAQSLDRVQRGQAKDMLNAVKKEIKDKYYDPTFHGIDLDARFKAAEEKLDKATTLGQAFGIIAQAVLELNDSHTSFFPPSRTGTVEYGWRMQMIGDKCYIIAVKPGSDAEKKGLKIGDEVIAIEGFRPNRKEMWKINYYYNVLSPRAALNVKVQSPDEKEPRELNIVARRKQMQAVMNIDDQIRDYDLASAFTVEHRFVKIGNTMVWRMPTFVIEPEQVDSIMQGRIGKAGNLILDLRGNGGGYVVTLERLAGYFVDKDTKIADLKGRKEMKPQMAKTKGSEVFKGKVIVLIDSNSGSAAEIFARFIQIQERGVVLGDQSAGAVMQSRGVPMQMSTGENTSILYGMNMTNADVITTDGKSLEHVGVTPQVKMIPTGADLAAQRDPVLAAALQLLGETATPEQLGKLFPYNWKEDL